MTHTHLTPSRRVFRLLLSLTLATVALLLQPTEAQATPAYRATGTFTFGTGDITPPYPASMAANDVCLLAVESENETIALTTANGFVELPYSPQSAGTAATSPASRLAVFWKRTVGGDAAPVVTDSGNHTTARIHCFSGVITSGNPWDIGAGGNDGGANDTSGTIPGATTTTADTLVVLLTSTSSDSNSTTNCSGWTNVDLTSLTEQTDDTRNTALGGGHCMATGVKASAGTYGTTTLTLSNTSYKGAISLALKPAQVSVVSINRVSAEVTSPSTAVSWTVTFNESVTGVDTTDFALVESGLSGSSITGVSGSGTTWTVNATTGTGSGTLGLNLVDDDTIKNAALSPLGGSGTGNGNFAGQTYAVSSAPYFQAAGGTVDGTGSVSPSWPTHAIGDVALLFVESTGGEPVTLSTPAGFVAVTNSPQATGTTTNGTQISVFWARATSTSMAAPTVADPGNHVFAQIITYRGAVTTGNPWDVTGGNVKATSSTALTVTGVTTTVADTLIVQVATRDNDANGAAFSAQSNATLLALAERSDDGTNRGNGGGFAVWDGILLAAGASGDTTATVSNSVNAFLTIALKKRSYPVAVSIDRASTDPADTGTVVSWTVTFSDAVTGVDVTDFALVMGGGASGASITTVVGSGTTWTVNANTGTSSGTLGLNLVDDDTIIDSGALPIGGAGTGNGNFNGQVYTITLVPGTFVFTSSSCVDGVAFGGPGQCALVVWSPQLAGQNLTSVYITAVDGSNVPTKLHSSQDRTRDMSFALSCQNPVANAGRQASFAGQTLPLCEANGATPTTWTPVAVTVTFLAGVPSSSVSYTFNYADVGLVNLWMRNNAKTSETGNSGVFVVKPGGFALSAIQQTAAPNLANPGAADANGAKFIKAGEAFSVTVTATTIDGVTAVPNYGKEISPETVKLGVNLIAPAGGTAPSLQNETAFGSFSGGIATGTTFAWDEVGIITLTPSVGNANYLGKGDVTGTTSGNVGRFFPDHFALTPEAVDSLIDRAEINTGTSETCPSTFTYLGEDFKTRFALSALNVSNSTTQNYTSSFAKLDLSAWANFTFSASGLPAGSTLGSGTTAPSGTWSNGGANVVAHHKASRPSAAPVAPGTGVAVSAKPVDGDGVTMPATVQTHSGTTDLRYGRLQLLNAYGSELLNIRMPVRTEFFTSTNTWSLNSADNCTVVPSSSIALGNYLPPTSGTAVSAANMGVAPTDHRPVSNISLTGGSSTVVLTKPNPAATGTFDVVLNLGTGIVSPNSCATGTFAGGTAASLDFLLGKWCGSNYDRAPSARVKLGSPKAPYIYLRERY